MVIGVKGGKGESQTQAYHK